MGIPKGCPDGHVIKSNGKQFAVHSKMHSDFVRVGKRGDLYTNVSITLEEALLGFDLKVNAIDDELIEIAMDKLPHSREYKLKNKGLPRFEGTTRGHLYVSFDVLLPVLNDRERQEFKEYMAEHGEAWNYSKAKMYRKKQQMRKDKRNKRSENEHY